MSLSPETRALVRTALENLLDAPVYPYAPTIEAFSYNGLLRDMRTARAHDSGAPLNDTCGPGSRMLKSYFHDYFKERKIDGDCIAVRGDGAVREHAYDLVRVNRDVIVADFSIGQYLDKPVTNFGPLGMFLGTREELKAHIEAVFAQRGAPAEDAKNLWARAWGDVSTPGVGEPVPDPAAWGGQVIVPPSPGLKRLTGWRRTMARVHL
jgi:hypothetical protein